jgi:CelD/BcsL family acetyltransferase involved in cellulose biosynthesis
VHGTLHPQAEWRSLASLKPIVVEWASLAQRAIEPNVFYDPAFALAAASVFGKDAGAVLIWSHSAPRQLVGFFPATIERFRYGLPVPVLVGWTHAYAPLGTPLVDRLAAEEVISAWLDYIAADRQIPNLVLMPYLPVQGAFASAFARALTKRGGRRALFKTHARALLAPGGERASYLQRAIAPKKRKDLRRQRKRLAERGQLVSAADSTAPCVAAALDDFFALEAGGWKGRAGTAARCRDEIKSFVAQAVSGLAQHAKAQIMRLCVDGRAIAALIVLRSGNAAWVWKIAHAENYARYSPGVQVLLDATESLLADDRIQYVDSCATADHPMIDHLWRERLALGDLLFTTSSAGAATFALVRRCEAARHVFIRGGRMLRDRVREKRSLD